MSWRRPATPLLCRGNQALAAGPETRRRSVDGRVCLRNSPRPGESRSCLSGSPSVNVGLVPPVWQWHLGGEVCPNNKHLSIGGTRDKQEPEQTETPQQPTKSSSPPTTTRPAGGGGGSSHCTQLHSSQQHVGHSISQPQKATTKT